MIISIQLCIGYLSFYLQNEQLIYRVCYIYMSVNYIGIYGIVFQDINFLEYYIVLVLKIVYMIVQIVYSICIIFVVFDIFINIRVNYLYLN